MADPFYLLDHTLRVWREPMLTNFDLRLLIDDFEILA